MGRPKIYYNVNKSDYIVKTENFIYYFSSLLYRDKFLKKLKDNRTELHYKLSSRYNIKFIAVDYFDIILYSLIEKRGFYIVNIKTEEVFKCLKNIILNGVIKM